jgi:hypothetical protein
MKEQHYVYCPEYERFVHRAFSDYSQLVTNRNIRKEFDNFDMRPLKLDASIRTGWGKVSLSFCYRYLSGRLVKLSKTPEVIQAFLLNI